MKILISLLISAILCPGLVLAQNPPSSSGAANPSQLAQPSDRTPEVREFKIPAGTPIEVEVAYTVNSQYVRAEDLISFRVVVPVKVDGTTLIERFSLVTGRVVQAKRGGHWGRAGKLSWIMQDVVAVDLTRVAVEARANNPNEQMVKGTSHAGQVATEMIVFGSLMWVIAPVVLLHGFKRGENAILPEGRRFIVFVKQDTIIKTSMDRASVGASPATP